MKSLPLRFLLDAIRDAAKQAATGSDLTGLLLALLNAQDQHAGRMAEQSAAITAAQQSARTLRIAKGKVAATLTPGQPISFRRGDSLLTVERVEDHRQLVVKESRIHRMQPAQLKVAA